MVMPSEMSHRGMVYTHINQDHSLAIHTSSGLKRSDCFGNILAISVVEKIILGPNLFQDILSVCFESMTA